MKKCYNNENDLICKQFYLSYRTSLSLSSIETTASENIDMAIGADIENSYDAPGAVAKWPGDAGQDICGFQKTQYNSRGE